MTADPQEQRPRRHATTRSDHILVRSHDAYWLDVGDETLLFHGERRELTHLDRPGSVIWDLVGGSTLDEITEAIVQATDADRPTVRRDVEDTVAALLDAGLVRWEETGDLSAPISSPVVRQRTAPIEPADDPEARQRRLDAAGAMLIREVGAVRVIETLEDAGLRPILLKGPAIAHWLYDEPWQRGYVDIDILVRPDRFTPAQEVLRDGGFERAVTPFPVEIVAPHGLALRRRSDGMHIDLHRWVWGTATRPEHLWDVFDGRREALVIAGRVVDCLDVASRLLHLCLHLAQNRVSRTKKIADLERALDRVSVADWEAATRLAGEIDAGAAMALGLRQISRGRTLADQLDLPAPTRDPDLYLRGGDRSPRGSMSFLQLLTARDWRTALRYGFRKVFPPPALVAEQTPYPVDSPRSWVRAYLRRLWLVLVNAPSALRAAVRALLRSRR